MKIQSVLCWIVLMWMMTGCFDDKGNYTYQAINEIKIEGLPEESSYRANIDTIRVNPVVTSALEGIIEGDNPDYSFSYRYVVENGTIGDVNTWTVLDSSFTKDLNLFANLLPRKYKCRFTVTDNRTGVETSAIFRLNVGTVIQKGWLVLCNEGEEQRLRLDMVGVLSETDEVVAYDLLRSRGLPDARQAVSLGFQPTDLLGGEDNIWVFSKEGGYKLHPETLETGEEYNVRYEFGNMQVNGCPQRFAYTKSYRLVVDAVGDGYYQDASSDGSVYGFTFNTMVPESEPQFKLAPYILTDPYTETYYRGYSAVVYDITNKRFLEWSEKNESRCLEITNPSSGRKFDYTTGKDLVYMEITSYNNNTIYAILKDAQGKYSLNSFHMLTNWGMNTQFRQQDSLALDIPGIEKARCFAFSSNYPYMFYAIGNVVYELNLDTKNSKAVLTLENDKEEITLLKFNLFKMDYENKSPKPDAFMKQQYQLIVGSVDTGNTSLNNGILRFCEVPALSQPLVVKKQPYTGFGKIVDVVYRERL